MRRTQTLLCRSRCIIAESRGPWSQEQLLPDNWKAKKDLGCRRLCSRANRCGGSNFRGGYSSWIQGQFLHWEWSCYCVFFAWRSTTPFLNFPIKKRSYFHMRGDSILCLIRVANPSFETHQRRVVEHSSFLLHCKHLMFANETKMLCCWLPNPYNFHRLKVKSLPPPVFPRWVGM